MAYSSLILKSHNDFALKTCVGSNTPPSLDNCCPDHWFRGARRLLHRMHIKGIEWATVRLDYDSEPLKRWAGQSSGPVVIYERERPQGVKATSGRRFKSF
jgi:hypothetical protein